jgi:hypothetical protein
MSTVGRTDHENTSEFALRGIGPDAPIHSDWTTWHVARSSETRVREGGKRVKKRWLRSEPWGDDGAIYASRGWDSLRWRDHLLRLTVGGGSK